MPQKTNDKYLLLIRHSAVQIDRQQPSNSWFLSAEGRERCRQFARFIAPFEPSEFITSFENKAVETGALLARELHVPTISFLDLHAQDRQDAPFFSDEQKFRNAIGLLFASPEKLAFGRETAAQANERFEAAINRLIAQNRDRSLAVVTHGTVMTLFVNRHNPSVEPLTF